LVIRLDFFDVYQFAVRDAGCIDKKWAELDKRYEEIHKIRLCLFGSQADAESLRKIGGVSLLLTKTESIQDEVVGEACSLWTPEMVDGLSTRFHGRIVGLIFEMQLLR
jgi:hypothetical protein